MTRILYCVLNWGLGHATRSIPVIRALQDAGCEVEIASDGGPLTLLRKTFPTCITHTLPAYDIRYPSRSVVINAITQLRKMRRAAYAERQAITEILKTNTYDAIVSDNRYGCHHPSVPSVLITHQLRNLATSSIISKPGEWIVDSYLRHFDAIWVPDTPDRILSGKMTDMISPKLRFIGHLSDQHHIPMPAQYEIAAILSGPEPQRTYLEQEILTQLVAHSGRSVLVRGVVADLPQEQHDNVTILPYADRTLVNKILNSASVVVCRTGFSSLMDLLQTGTRAVLIPTPGQPEQEYLGERLRDHKQFVVQQQGKSDISAAYQALISRDTTPPPSVAKQELLTRAVTELLGR